MLQPIDKLRVSLGLVVLVVGHTSGGDTVVVGELAGVPAVLRVDHIGELQHPQGSEGDVF